MENKPAFPCADTIAPGGERVEPIHTGLTKREYFAAIAMQSYKSWILNPSKQEIENYSKLCVQIADSILKELNK